MARQQNNRIDSLWREPSPDGREAALAGAKMLADKFEPMIEEVETAIAEYPRTTLTVAAVLGVACGWFIKRK